MKHERTLKTAIVLGVTAAHIGLYAALDKVAAPPEPVEVEQLTMVDLDALADGGHKAADSPPPAAKPAPPPPPPPKPKPKPEPVKKPQPKAPEPKPVVKAVVKDNAPPDLRPERETPKPKPPKPKAEPKQPEPKPKAEPKPPKPQPELKTAEPVEKAQPEPKPKLKVAAKHSDSEAKSAAPADTGSRAAVQASAENKGGDGKNRQTTSSGGGNGRDDKAGGSSGSRERGDGGNGGDGKRKNDSDNDKPKKAFSGIADGGYRTMPVLDCPEASMDNDESGTVKIKVVVEPNGRVSDADVVSSSGHSRLDRAALRAAKSASYKPKSVDGEPVRTRFTAAYKFDCNN